MVLHSEKIERVQEKANELWRYQSFWLIYEYEEKTVLPPPLNILCHIFNLIEHLLCCCKNRFKPRQDNRHTSKTMRTLEISMMIYHFQRKHWNEISRSALLLDCL